MTLTPKNQGFAARGFALRAALGLAAVGLVACGTDVRVGRNDVPPRDASDIPLDEGGDGQAGNGDQAAAPGSCFGVADAAAMAALKDFCESTPDDLRQAFARAHGTVCQEKRLANVYKPGCAWDGQDAATQSRAMRIMEKTALDDPGAKFRLYVAFAVTVQDSPEDFVDTVFRGYSDPDFTKTFLSVKGSRLANVTADRAAGRVGYDVELATSAAVAKYRGELRIVRYPSGLIAVFDQAVDKKVLVDTSHFLYLVRPAGEGQATVLGIDEKVVDDGGNHRLANNTTLGLDRERMEIAYENARRR